MTKVASGAARWFISSRKIALAARLVILLAIASWPQSLPAAESSFEDRPAGESVENLDSPLTRAIEERERLQTLFPRLKRRMQLFPNFVADTELTLNFRSFYFPLRKRDGRDAYAWTAGGKLAFRSGWWKERLQIGAGLYTSFPLAADDPEALTQLLREDERGFAVLGEAYLRLRWRDVEATLFRHELDLPYVNRNDSRMAPNSFQGVTAKGIARGVPWLHRVDWVAGYLSDIRPRNDKEFISMSEQAGAVGTNEGMLLAGVQFQPLKNLSLGGYNYWVKDTFNTGYLAGDYLWKLNADWATRFQGQFTHQASVGDEFIGSFRTWVASGRIATSFRGFTGWLAFSKTDDEERIRSPYGSYAGYISLMQSDFNQAGERAWSVGLSVAPKAIPGWSGFFQYARGDGGFDPLTLVEGADEQEFDLTVDYEIKEGRWRGFWLRLRGSALDAKGEENTAWPVRVIPNYTLPIL
jgi:hypothetical protein